MIILVTYDARNFTCIYHYTLIAARLKLAFIRHLEHLLHCVIVCIEDVSIRQVSFERAAENDNLWLSESGHKGVRSCSQHARYDRYRDPLTIHATIDKVACIKPFNAIEPLNVFVVSAEDVD